MYSALDLHMTENYKSQNDMLVSQLAFSKDE
jgi:hypothetical protein